MKNRILWIDDLKGLLMVFIVAGHVFATLSAMTIDGGKASAEFFFNLIYSFHIPFYFLIAGMTLPPPRCDDGKVDFWLFAKRKFVRIMVPYYFWGCVCALLFVLLGQMVASEVQAVSSSGSFGERTLSESWYVPFLSLLHAGCWPNNQGFRFNGVLWFLPMLFICHIIHFGLTKLFRSVAALLFISSICMCLTANLTKSVFDQNMPFDLTRVPIHLVFLSFGNWIGCMLFHRDDRDSWRRWLYYGVALLCVCYVFAARYFPITFTREYAVYSMNSFLRPLPSIGVMMLIATLGWIRAMRCLVPLSLGIMIFHKYPLVLAQIVLGKLGVANWCGSLASILLGFLLSAFLVMTCYWASRLVVKFAPWSLGLQKSQ